MVPELKAEEAHSRRIIRRAWATLLSTALISGCALQAVRDTSLPPDAQRLPHLARQPAPAWNIPFEAKEIDHGAVIAPGRLLATTLDLTGAGNIWRPNAKALTLFDTQAGKLVWSTGLEDMVEEVHTVGVFGNRVMLRGRPPKNGNPEAGAWALRAFAVDTGNPVWQKSAPESSRYQTVPARDLVVVAHAAGAAIEVSGLSIEDGRELWTVRINDGLRPPGTGIRLALSGDAVLVSGAVVASLGLTDVRVRWRADLAPGEEDSTLSLDERHALVISPKGVRALDLRTGREQWHHQPQGTAVTVTAVQEADALLVLDRGPDASVVVRLDPVTGKLIWKAAAEYLVRSPIAIIGDLVFYTTRDRLVAIDLRSGALRWQGVLPVALRSPVGLPDLVVQQGDRIVVAREIGVAAFDRETGRLQIAEYVSGARAHSHAFLNLRNVGRRAAAGGPRPTLVSQYAAGAQLQATAAASYAMSRASADLTIRSSQARYDYVRMQTQSVLDSPRSSSNERMLALQTRESAARANYETQKAAAQAELQAATAAFVVSLAGAAQQFGVMYRGKWVEAGFQLAEAQERFSRTTHLNSLQGGYYLRPFYRDGWGVTLVRLADGSRADLYVSPPNEALLINAANLPLFLIDASGNRLLAKGLGIGLKDIPTYDKVAWPETPGGMFGLPDNFRVPYPSVLAYDLGRMPFSSARGDGTDQDPWPVLGTPEQQLREAILSGDEAAVKRLLAAGANPSAVDSLGLNALFYAAMVDHKDIVKALIEAGANATHRDDQGWLAVNYGFMTVQVPQATYLIMQANEKQRAQ